MIRRSLPICLMSFLAGAGLCAAAGSGVIGVAVSETPITVNQSSVDGNANLASGSVVRTGNSSGRLQMMDGSRIVVGRQSEVKVFENKIVLGRGASQVSSRSGYAVEALGVKVAPQAAAQAEVAIQDGRVLVAALNGPVKVWNSAGLPVANVVSGRSLSFEPGSTGSSTSVMRGTVAREGSRIVLPDETSGLRVELQGAGLDREVGRRVEVSGAAKASPDSSTQVIEVAKLTRLSEDPSPAGGAPNPKPMPQGGGGSSAGLVIGLIVFGGIIGGTAAYIGTQDEKVVTISR